LLNVRNLARHFATHTVLEDVSFVVNDHERVGLVGPNGAGTSTLLRGLAGLDQPDAGTIAGCFYLFYGDAPLRRVGACSLGEQTRLQLACLVLRGCNLLLLDEPLNHLDIEGREHFLEALDVFRGTVIAVAHDRAFVQSFAEQTIAL
jgi:ATP-binding cassette subfamily F protein 3